MHSSYRQWLAGQQRSKRDQAICKISVAVLSEDPLQCALHVSRVQMSWNGDTRPRPCHTLTMHKYHSSSC